MFAKYMMDVAVDCIRRGRYVASAYALLVVFEEIIDAYSAEDGKHFHEEYLADAWKARLEWMKSRGLLDLWERLVYLCSRVVGGRDEEVEDMLRLVRGLMDGDA